MDKKISLLLLIGLVLIPQLVLADMIMPIYFLPFMPALLLPIIILIEAFIFWWFINKIFKVKVSFWKSLLITFVANMVTSLIGAYLPLILFTPDTGPESILIIEGITFVLTVFIEWMVYIIFMKKTTAKKFDLLKISFVANFVTYALITLLFSNEIFELLLTKPGTNPAVPKPKINWND